MKNILLVGLLIIIYSAKSQDTIVLLSFGDGGFVKQIVSKNDTIIIGNYNKSLKELTIKTDKKTGLKHYVRYYRNGKKMWDKQILNDQENGISIFYNQKGLEIAKLSFKDGSIIDTLFIKQNTTLLIGEIRYRSTVFGGVENEDGTSNVSIMEGVSQHCTMKWVEIQNLSKLPKNQEYNFTTDFKGDFICVLEIGNYVLFEKEQVITNLDKYLYTLCSLSEKTGKQGWNFNSFIPIEVNTRIELAEILQVTEHYAP